MKNINMSILGISITTVAYIFWSNYKNKNIKKNIEILYEALEKDISPHFTDTFVKETIRSISKNYISDIAKSEVHNSFCSDIHKQVAHEVETQYKDIKKIMEQELAEQIQEKIDLNQIEASISRKVKSSIEEKIDGRVTYILDSFSQNLKNTTKIYDSLSDMIKPK